MPTEIDLAVIHNCASDLERLADRHDGRVQHLVRRFLGALHALLRAHALGFRDDRKSLDGSYNWVGETAKRLSTGQPLADDAHKAFLSDFYFNVALDRLNAIRDTVERELADPALRSTNNPDLDAIRKDVNALKHDLEGLLSSNDPGRTATVETIHRVLPTLTSAILDVTRRR